MSVDFLIVQHLLVQMRAYLANNLSPRNFEEIMTERSMSVDRATIDGAFPQAADSTASQEDHEDVMDWQASAPVAPVGLA